MWPPGADLRGLSMNSQICKARRLGRREFLSCLSGAAAGSALALGTTRGAGNVNSADTDPRAPLLPTIRLGEHRVTRLIVGSNPISGYSYMGPIMDRHMKEYFTDEKIAEFLWRCESEGINAHQGSSPERMAPILRTLRQRGSKMKFICLHAGGQGRMPVDKVVTETQPVRAPIWVADRGAKPPRKRPMGVRAPERMTGILALSVINPRLLFLRDERPEWGLSVSTGAD